MINPIQSINLNHYPHKNSVSQRRQQDSGQLQDLSGYAVGQAILARNNISFRACAEPIDVTPLYNKRIEGKDHLDLPNIHVYEFPDTNLQVFIDANPNMGKYSEKVQTKLYVENNNIKEESLVKKEICIRLLNQLVKQKDSNAKVYSNLHGFFTLSADLDQSGYRKLEDLNKIINTPDFIQADLDKVKAGLIQEVNQRPKEIKIAEILPKFYNDLKSPAELTDEIKKITLADIQEYYSQSIKNSEARYFITADKNFVDKNSKEIFKSLNSNIARPYQKHTNKKVEKNKFFPNQQEVRILNNKNKYFVEMYYPCSSENLREHFINIYTSFLCIFMRDPYISEDSTPKALHEPIGVKTHWAPYKAALNFQFLPFDKISDIDESILVQKGMLYDLYDKDFTTLLNSMKTYGKELHNKRLNQEFDITRNNNELYDYGYDIFNLYEIEDSINVEDIKQALYKYIISQEPIVIINNTNNIQKELIYAN